MKKVFGLLHTVLISHVQQQAPVLYDSVSGQYFSGQTHINTPAGAHSFSPKRIKRFFQRFSYPILILIILIILIGILLIVRHAGRQTMTSSQPLTASQTQVPPPLAQQTLKKPFIFPLRDANGKEVSQLQYELLSAELDTQIILQGQKATAVAGREFLIINLKITNNYSKSINLNTRDYVRLSVNGSDEKLAPDIYNDPVQVQAISTKYTRLGFAINTTDKDLILQVGEITGPKQTISLTLQ